MDLNNNKGFDKNIDIKNFLDISFLQILQDSLANSLGVAAIITDINGFPITKPSHFTDFCNNFIRKSHTGFKNCNFCDAYGGNYAAIIKKPLIYKCHIGLIDFASPIFLDNIQIGYLLGGQVLDCKPNIDEFKKNLKNLNIITSDSILETELNKINIIPLEKIQYSANLFYELASKISNFCFLEYKTRKYFGDFLDNIDSISENYNPSAQIQNHLEENSCILNEIAKISKNLSLLNKKIKNNIKEIVNITDN